MKPGDVVRLKSGGPAMTVESAQVNGRLWCEWFLEGKPIGRPFDPITLKLLQGVDDADQ